MSTAVRPWVQDVVVGVEALAVHVDAPAFGLAARR
jgi:hypothetical protein